MMRFKNPATFFSGPRFSRRGNPTLPADAQLPREHLAAVEHVELRDAASQDRVRASGVQAADGHVVDVRPVTL